MANDPQFALVASLLHFDAAVGTDVTGRTWTTTGAPALSAVQSKFGGKSLYLNGSSAISHAGYAFGTGDFTIECWVYATNTANGAWQRIFGQYVTSGYGGVALNFATDGRPVLSTIGLSDTATFRAVGNNAISSNAWHHFAIVRQGNRVALFVDGVTVCHTLITSAINAYAFAMGAISALNAEFTTGYVDDFRVTIGLARYPFSVVDPYIDQVVYAQPFRNNSAHWFVGLEHQKSATNNGIIPGAVTNPFGAEGYAAYFNGAAYATLPAHNDFNFGSGDFTIEAWIRPDNVTAGTWKEIFANEWTNAYNNGYGFGLHGADLMFMCKTTNNVSLFHSGGPLVAGAWQHVAVSRKGPVCRLFINGVQKAVKIVNSEPVGYAAACNIGRSSASITDYMVGYISDLRVTKGVARYVESFSVPTDYLPTVEGSFTVPSEPYPSAATKVSGRVIDASGANISRRVAAHSTATGALLGWTMSNATTGEFSIGVPEPCYCVCLDDAGSNALVYAGLTPE